MCEGFVLKRDFSDKVYILDIEEDKFGNARFEEVEVISETIEINLCGYWVSISQFESIVSETSFVKQKRAEQNGHDYGETYFR